MPYSKEYLQIQLMFAQRVASVTGEKLDSVLLNYTAFYKHFGISGWGFDATNPLWQKFLQAFNESTDKIQTIYDFCPSSRIDSERRKMFGCFSYDYSEKTDHIYIHFKNVDNGQSGPLHRHNIEKRKAELKSMFEEIYQRYPNVGLVSGFSWLYNIEAYKRLFPNGCVQNVTVATDWFQSVALWGQFLDNKGNLKKEIGNTFIEKVRTATTLDGLKNSFPYKVLIPEASPKIFYEFYGIEWH